MAQIWKSVFDPWTPRRRRAGSPPPDHASIAGLLLAALQTQPLAMLLFASGQVFVAIALLRLVRALVGVADGPITIVRRGDPAAAPPTAVPAVE